MTDAAREEAIDLTAWRDAAVEGGLPMPGRDRWQPLRGGVVGMWEFEVCEYWFADGRAQLMGRNESGKSTLMTLTTLILLAGDTSAHNIDTIGGTNKRFRYYVEPTGADDDRRDASKSTSRGWTWIEYGRLGDEGPEFFTALLHASAKRGGDRPSLTWAISDGPGRVRDGITLVRANTTVSPGEACDGPGWHTFANNSRGYRDHLARGLFGTDADRLDGYARMLKVIRTPKLGARLNLDFVDEKLREALPPLAAHEVDQLASGWDELERIAADRDSADEARTSVEAYVKQAWQPWAHAEARRSADAVVNATSELDDITRRAREAQEGLEAADKKLAKLETSTASTRTRRDASADEADGLRRTQRYQDAETAVATAELLAETASTARATATSAGAEATETEDAASMLSTRAADADTAVAEAGTTHSSAAAAVVETATVAGLVDAQAWVDNDDIARVDQAQRERRGQVTEMRSRLRAVAAAEDTLGTRQRDLGDAEQRHTETTERLSQSRTDADDAAQTVVDDLGRWAIEQDLQPTAEHLAEWSARIDEITAADQPSPELRALVERDHLAPQRSALATAVERENSEAAAATARAEAHAAEIDRLRATPEPEPEQPHGWTRRQRPAPGPDGASLWRLLNPRPGVPDIVIDHVEAALAAMGLLDAWVTPDGVWREDRDGDDVIVVTTSAGADGDDETLADILVAIDDDGDDVDATTAAAAAGDTGTAAAAARFLRAVAFDGGAGVGAGAGALRVGIAADGRWWSPTAAGRAAPAPDGATLLGTEARARNIARQIERLTDERSRELAAVENAHDRSKALLERIAGLDRAADALPDDRDLVAKVFAVRSAERDLASAETLLERATKAHEDAERFAGDERSNAAQWAGLYALPMQLDELDEITSSLTELALRAEKLRGAAQAAAQARQRAEELRGDAGASAAKAATARSNAEQADRDATRVEARSKAATDALDGETQQILGRVQQLTEAVARLDKKLEEMQTEREGLLVAKTQAEGQLASRNEDAERARGRRDTVTNAWWKLVDSGLPAVLGLAAPAARSYTSALESARTARAQVRVNDWPAGDAEAQAKRIERAWQRVNTDSIAVRTVLEAGAGRGIRVVVGDEEQMARVDIVVDSTGEGYDPPTAVRRLAEQHDELKRSYDENMHRTLHELLGSTFIEHLRDRLVEVESLNKRINETLVKHPTGTTQTMLRLKRVPRDGDPDAAEVLSALEGSSYELLSEDAQQQVRNFLQHRINDARDAARAAADPDWRGRLAGALDYRAWFAWSIDKRVGDGGRWTALTAGTHGKLSGGASVVTLMLPLVATLAAMYEIAPSCPRPVWLDEAFDGVDADNRTSVLGLLREFDMDYLLAGPGLLVKAPTVPAAAIWEVVRAEHPLPGADLELMLWASGELNVINVPDPVVIAARDARPAPAKT